MAGTRRSYLITRWERTQSLASVLTRATDDSESARAARREVIRSAARLLARLHAAGVCYRRIELDYLLLRTDGDSPPLLARLDELRVRRQVKRRARVASLAQLAEGVAELWPSLTRAELALLLAEYRDGGEAADATWRTVFSDVERTSSLLDGSAAVR